MGSKLSRREFHGTSACRRFREDLLKYELNRKMSNRGDFKESYEQARASLQSILSPMDFNHVCSTLETKASKLKDRLSRKLEVKFNNLKRKCGIPLASNLGSDDIIFNYSHRVLTEAEKMLLAR